MPVFLPSTGRPMGAKDHLLNYVNQRTGMADYLTAKTVSSFQETTLGTYILENKAQAAELEEYGPQPGRTEPVQDYWAMTPQGKAAVSKRPGAGGPVPFQEQRMSEKEWRDSEYYREGIEFSEDFTPARAKVYAEFNDDRQYLRALIGAKEPGPVTGVLGFGAAMLGQLGDPINYIGLPALRGGQALWKMAGWSAIDAAMGNLAVDAVVFPYLNKRGEDFRAGDYLLDMALGAVIGGVAGGAFGAAGRAKVKRLKANQKAQARMVEGMALDIAQIQQSLGREVDVSPVLNTDFRNKSAQQVDAELSRLGLNEPGYEPDWSTAKPYEWQRSINEAAELDPAQAVEIDSGTMKAEADEALNRVQQMELTEAEDQLLTEVQRNSEMQEKYAEASEAAAECVVRVAT